MQCHYLDCCFTTLLGHCYKNVSCDWRSHLPRGGGGTHYVSDGFRVRVRVRVRPFLGLKLAIWVFFGLEILWGTFCG